MKKKNGIALVSNVTCSVWYVHKDSRPIRHDMLIVAWYIDLRDLYLSPISEHTPYTTV